MDSKLKSSQFAGPECLMPNCRRTTDKTEAMCSAHRREQITDPDKVIRQLRAEIDRLREVVTELEDRIIELEGIIDAGADRGDFLYEQHKDRLLEKDDE